MKRDRLSSIWARVAVLKEDIGQLDSYGMERNGAGVM